MAIWTDVHMYRVLCCNWLNDWLTLSSFTVQIPSLSFLSGYPIVLWCYWCIDLIYLFYFTKGVLHSASWHNYSKTTTNTHFNDVQVQFYVMLNKPSYFRILCICLSKCFMAFSSKIFSQITWLYLRYKLLVLKNSA